MSDTRKPNLLADPNWADRSRPYYRMILTPTGAERRTFLHIKGKEEPHVETPEMPAVLTEEEWKTVDELAEKAYNFRTPLTRLIASHSSLGGFNGMSKMVLEHEEMTPQPAVVDMDGITKCNGKDTPTFKLVGLPLPITHSDAVISQRMLQTARATGLPQDFSPIEISARRVGEYVERTLLGLGEPVRHCINPGIKGYEHQAAVYGLLNFPHTTHLDFPLKKRSFWTRVKDWVFRRKPKKILRLLPTGKVDFCEPIVVVEQVLRAMNILIAKKFYGSYLIIHGNRLDPLLDNDYILTKSHIPTMTLRQRIRDIDGVIDVVRADFLNSTQIILVQLTPEVIRIVEGCKLKVVQWPSAGGMQVTFKTLCIVVPQVRADFYGNAGIAVLE